MAAKKSWVVVCLLAGCGSAAPIPDCPAPDSPPGNKGSLYYRHNYEFDNADGCFQASFPAPPRATQHIVHSALGTIDQRVFSAATDTSNRFVIMIQLPWLLGTVAPKAKIIDNAEGEFLKQENAKKLSEKDVTVQGYEGKLIKFERKSGDKGHAYILPVKHRAYIVVGQSTEPTANVGMDFLHSFKLDQACLDKL
jgi:hypothetical protein